MTRYDGAIPFSEFNRTGFDSDIHEREYSEDRVDKKGDFSWVIRWYDRKCLLDKDLLYARFFRLLAPDMLIPRYPVYVPDRFKKKIFVSSARPYLPPERLSLDGQRPSPTGWGIAQSFAILFFLNQSYSCLQKIWWDCLFQYKIVDFDPTIPCADLSASEWESFIPSCDAGNDDIRNLIAELDRDPVFFENRMLMLMVIALLPSFDELFDLDELDGLSQLRRSLIARQTQLKQYLLKSKAFMQLILGMRLMWLKDNELELKNNELEVNIKIAMAYLKRYSSKNFDLLKTVFFENLQSFIFSLQKEAVKNIQMRCVDNEHDFAELKFRSALSRYLSYRAEHPRGYGGEKFVDDSYFLKILLDRFVHTVCIREFNFFFLFRQCEAIAKIYGVQCSNRLVTAEGARSLALVAEPVDEDESQFISFDEMSKTLKTGAFVQRCLGMLVEQREVDGQLIFCHKNNLQWILKQSKYDFMGSEYLSHISETIENLNKVIQSANFEKALSIVFVKIMYEMPPGFVRVFLKYWIAYCYSEMYVPQLIEIFLSKQEAKILEAQNYVGNIIDLKVNDAMTDCFYEMANQIIHEQGAGQGWTAAAIMRDDANYARMISVPRPPLPPQKSHSLSSLFSSGASASKKLIGDLTPVAEKAATVAVTAASTLWSQGVPVAKEVVNGLAPVVQGVASATVETAKTAFSYLSGLWGGSK